MTVVDRLDRFLKITIPGYATLADTPSSTDDATAYFHLVDTLAQDHVDQVVFTGDVHACSQKYLYALRALARTAASQITMFTDGLPLKLEDGTLLYADEAIIETITRFMRNPASQLTILTRSPVDELIRNHPFIRSIMQSKGHFSLYTSSDEDIRASALKWLVVDKRGYNLRFARRSRINFNDPEFASRLNSAFEDAISLPTTYRVDPSFVSELAAAA